MNTNNPQFRITADGFVHRRKLDRYERLGHIGSILHPMNQTHTAHQVRAWWNALLVSNEPIEEYVPPKKQSKDHRIRVRATALVVSSAFGDDAVAELVWAAAGD